MSELEWTSADGGARKSVAPNRLTNGLPHRRRGSHNNDGVSCDDAVPCSGHAGQTENGECDDAESGHGQSEHRTIDDRAELSPTIWPAGSRQPEEVSSHVRDSGWREETHFYSGQIPSRTVSHRLSANCSPDQQDCDDGVSQQHALERVHTDQATHPSSNATNSSYREAQPSTSSGRRGVSPFTAGHGAGLPPSVWQQLEAEGLVPQGYCNGVLQSEPQDGMDMYFNSHVQQLGDPCSESEPGGAAAESHSMQVGMAAAKLSSSSEDLGDFIETDISLTPRFGNSSCANSSTSSLDELEGGDGGNDEGVDISGHDQWRHQHADHHVGFQPMHAPHYPVSCSQCNSQHSQSVGLCRQSPIQCREPDASTVGRLEQPSARRPSPTPAPYYSPDLDIEFIDLDIDSTTPCTFRDKGLAKTANSPRSQARQPRTAEAIPLPPQPVGAGNWPAQSLLSDPACNQVLPGWQCSSRQHRVSSDDSPCNDDVFCESQEYLSQEDAFNNPLANNLDAENFLDANSEEELFNVSRQTSTSNFDQDENSYQEAGACAIHCSCPHDNDEPAPGGCWTNNNYKDMAGRCLVHTKGLNTDTESCVNTGSPPLRPLPNSRASTWPRHRDAESSMSALKLLEYEFSGDDTPQESGINGRLGTFALSDDDSPINATRLLEGSVAVVASSKLDGDSSRGQEEHMRHRAGKNKMTKERTQLLLSILRMMHDGSNKTISNGTGCDPPEEGCTMIWSEYDAYVLQVKQIGTSACGATAVINVLKAFDLYADKSRVCEVITTNLRAENAPVPEYLQSRSVAGTTAECLIQGIQDLTGGSVQGRFFSFHPARDVDLHAWLAHWIKAGAVPLLTLNLQRGVTPGMEIPDAWHHQMCYGVGPQGAYLTNPLQVTPYHVLLAQLSGDSHLHIRRQDIIRRWTPHTNLSTLLHSKDVRWSRMNVLGQVVNVLREASAPAVAGIRPQLTSHITIPAWYKAGVTLFVKQDSDAHQALLAAANLPLLHPSLPDR